MQFRQWKVDKCARAIRCSLFGLLSMVVSSASNAATVTQSMNVTTGVEPYCQTSAPFWGAIAPQFPHDRQADAQCPLPTSEPALDHRPQKVGLRTAPRNNSVGVTFKLKDSFGNHTGSFYQEMLITELDFTIYGVHGNQVSNDWRAAIEKGSRQTRTNSGFIVADVDIALNNRSGLSLSFWSDRLFRTGGWRTAQLRRNQ